MPRRSKELPDIDFSSIRPLQGKQTDGFEELSVQLFRGETDGQGEFFRIEGSGGDGGVEAYRENSNGDKIAIQSKYFKALGNSQWNQVTKSVKAALGNHPALQRYVVSTPLNRSPGQTKKWKELTQEWLEHARSLGITHPVEFVWWGFSELTELLAKTTYRNQLVYWLGLPEFNVEWLDDTNRSNIELLGKRYSPKQHVETGSGVRLEAFAWGDDGKKKIINAFLRVAEKWRELDRRSTARARTAPESKDLTKSLQRTMRGILAFRWPLRGYPRIRPINTLCRTAVDICHDLEWKLRALNQEEKERRAAEKPKTVTSQSGPYSTLIHDLRKLAETLTELLNETSICQPADNSKLLLLGEAGSGKSHLIADLVDSAKDRAQPALLLLGEQFLGSEDPWTASTGFLGWNHSPDDLLAALDQEGIQAGRPALLCIDALNESAHRRLWQSHLIQFADRVARYPNVKLLVSCRSDFARITLPESICQGNPNAWPSLLHRGFGTEVIEAVQHYFDAFGIRAAYFPPVLEEFRNPLFLRVFCEAFEGQDLPSGPLSLDRVMRARVERLCSQIQKEIDCDPEDTRSALKDIAKAIAENGGRSVPRKTVRTKTEEHFRSQGASSSLYSRLVSNGMLVESVMVSKDDKEEHEVTVRFPFERFSDYFIASQILSDVESAEEFQALFQTGQPLAFFRDYWEYYENRGVARALAILVPERFNLELAQALTEPAIRSLVLEDFLESLAWRSKESMSDQSEATLAESRELGMDLLPTYFRLSTIPEHPYNSEFLGQRLAGLPMPERELTWTIPVSNLSSWEEDGILEEFLDWCFRVPTNLIPDEQALLAGRLLLWFCTSNHRALRKRSTLAAIRLLSGRPYVTSQLVSELHSVDDPYLLERLYAVAAGVAMRLPEGKGLSDLAETVHSKVFAHEQITPNILIRDFASTVLEACLAKGCLPSNILPDSFRPPFVTNWPTILSDEEVKRFEGDESWDRIVSSVRSESMGGYGDFGRYVMDASVHYFSDRSLTESPPDRDYRGHFLGRTARRWVLQRVEELGWTGELFDEYERRAPYGRQRHDIEEVKLERISKKYQWIALRELQGFLSDHYWLDLTWRNESEVFTGAWQINAREFDPSQRLVDLEGDEEAPPRNDRQWQENYPSQFQDFALCEDRVAWVTHPPDDFTSLLSPKIGTPDPNQQWLALAGHHEWVESEYDRVANGRRGALKMWIDVRSFLVPKKSRARFVKSIQGKHFYGVGCDLPEEHDGWIGTYPWSRSFDELHDYCEESDRWIGKLGIPYVTTVCMWSGGSTRIPSPRLCEILCLDWTGEGGTFHARNGEAVVGHLGGDAADWGRPLLIRQDALKSALDAAGLDIVWCVLAERSCWCSESNIHITGQELQVSAVYWLRGNRFTGGPTQTIVQEIPYR